MSAHQNAPKWSIHDLKQAARKPYPIMRLGSWGSMGSALDNFRRAGSVVLKAHPDFDDDPITDTQSL